MATIFPKKRCRYLPGRGLSPSHQTLLVGSSAEAKNRVFGGELEQMVEALNEAMAASAGGTPGGGPKRGNDPFAPFPNARWFP